LENANFGRDSLESEFSSLCPFVTISGNWDLYYKSFSKKFRKDIRNKTNKIKKMGEFELHVIKQVDNFQKLFTSIKEIESNSRKHNTEKEFFSSPANESFLKLFCETTVDKNWLDFSYISLNDTIIAYLIGFIYNKKYYAYNIAYSNEYFDVSPGKLLINEKIKWCFDNRDCVGEFDFLRGDFYIKSLWTTDARNHMRLVLFKKSLYSRMLQYLVFRVRPKFKPFIKKTKEAKL
jgi:CelD/BcsL family acetyltransferase involved in cellulose biosynthesis